MSLQHAAKYLAQNGRGKDTMLVHMTPKEVGSLQALARANGGSLSVNPDTGLPEAGFLDSLLPVLIGGGLAAATGGTSLALTPGMIGLGVGGLQALRTGDIGKGITAGLGAYGGAGLAGGLGALGASQAADAASAGMPGLGSDAMTQAQADAIASARSGAIADAQASPFRTMLEGAKAGISDPSKLLSMDTGMGLAKTGLAAASPLLSDMGQVDMPQAKGSGPNPYRYRFERGEASPFPEISQSGIERSYFPNARYVAYAGGGPVEAMSDANAIGANTGFPMADIQRGAYATPYQQPISQNVVTGDQDTRVDPYTGTERLAEGGVAEQNPLLESPYFPGRYEAGASDTAPAPAPSSPGQGISSGLTDLGLGLMGLAESAPGLATGIAGAIGSAIAGSQANAMGEAQSALGTISDMGEAAPGIASMSDSQGNVVSVSSPATVAAADAAIAAAIADAAAAVGDAASTSASSSSSAGVGGGTGSGSDGGTGDAGTATGDGGASAGPGEANGGLLRRKYATGGLSDLGGYSDGGRLLRGPGDGVSDSIPAVIGKRQPARLADGEFVVPARIVSELGNGSTEAGARKLYAMLDRVQKARGKTVGKGKVAKDSRADKYLPA